MANTNFPEVEARGVGKTGITGEKFLMGPQWLKPQTEVNSLEKEQLFLGNIREHRMESMKMRLKWWRR